MQVLSTCSFFLLWLFFNVIKADKGGGEENDWPGVVWRGVPAGWERERGRGEPVFLPSPRWVHVKLHVHLRNAAYVGVTCKDAGMS